MKDRKVIKKHKMEEYLIERDILVKLVGALLSKKYPDQSPADLNEIREKSVRELDDKISAKIFGSLSDEQLEEINWLLDDQGNSPTVFRNFFAKHSINLEEKISEAMQEYSDDFLGGKND